ncbi:disulfide reductase, partial [candidate division KSB1 bacterium]
SPDGFLQEAHPKFRPVDTLTEGVFLAGTVQGPKDIPDTVAQASAASSRAIRLMNKGEYEAEPITATVNEEICSGCATCVSVCPYDAIGIEITEGRRVAKVNEMLCKGCGSCAAACPSGASEQNWFKTDQLRAMVSAVL